MIVSHIILALGWILFCMLHSMLASAKFKHLAEKWMGHQFQFYRLYYTFFALICFAAVITYLFKIPSYRLFSTNIYSVIPGSIISLVGLVIMSMCTTKYFMQTTGLRALIENKTTNELLITGIHRYVRHPMYTGTFIFIWGLLILFPYLTTLITDIIITSYTLIGLRFEEQKLEKEFGKRYIEYKKHVPMLIPGLSQMRSNES